MKLFIDANIYLRFYDSKAENYQKLLKTLQEVRKDIIVTYQIEDEIVRNRYRLFKDSLSQYITKSQPELISIPAHISAKFDSEINEWNTERKKIHEQVKASNKTLLKISSGALQEVYSASDVVSKTLNSLFKDALKPSAQQLKDAITRKTKGNPPGKDHDPLGDQLNWEQLMASLRGVSKLFIVTQDKDYAVEIEKTKPVIHPLLLRDLKRKHPKIEVEVFYDLSSALKKFNKEKAKPLKSLPDSDVMKKIEHEEQMIFGSTIAQMMSSGSSITDIVGSNNPSITRSMQALIEAINSSYCKKCDKLTPTETTIFSFSDITTKLYKCTQCGHHKSE